MSNLINYLQRKCKEITCGNYFIPGNNRSNKISEFCSSACNNRNRSREWQAKHIRINGKWVTRND